MSRLTITVPDDIKQKLYQQIPKGKRAAYVTQAIIAALEHDQKKQGLKAIKNFKRYRVTKESCEIVRSLREKII